MRYIQSFKKSRLQQTIEAVVRNPTETCPQPTLGSQLTD